MTIDAGSLDFEQLGDQLRRLAGEEIVIERCLGQRYIGSGLKNTNIEIYGTPGNALGAYLGEGSRIVVHGNAQDATGDTMSGGSIVVHGSAGDAAGYGMRGGTMLVRDSAGYRAGIHMKQYGQAYPALVIGGSAGNFLGEYLAGGVILVLGLDRPAGVAPVGRFCGTGMHGGKIFLRGDAIPPELPPQVAMQPAAPEELEAEILPLVREYAEAFGVPPAHLTDRPFLRLMPNSRNPYHNMYVNN
ncbi:MAG: glutamate synthase [Oscillospiraceae bacterium]|nr:glutamate synthase [Oscillospiraceae bacterium]